MRLRHGTVALRVSTRAGLIHFRRGGIRFGQEPTIVELGKVSEEAAKAILGEKNLRVEELDRVPEGQARFRTREELEREVAQLRAETEQLRAQVQALQGRATPGADYDALSAADVRKLAKERGIDIGSQRKADLVEALQAADAQPDQGGATETEAGEQG